MDNNVNIEVTGDINAKGQISGTGNLMLQLSDIARANVTIDYLDKDKIILKVGSAVGFKISPQNTLTLSGDINKNIKNGELGGKVSAEFTINKDIAAKIEQTFEKGDNKTSLSVNIRL